MHEAIAGKVVSTMSTGEVTNATLATIFTCFLLGALLCGAVFTILALFPKCTQVLHFFPLPVLGGFIGSIGLYFVLGFSFAMRRYVATHAIVQVD
jgi:MFS superfamily sulfate permease-like transporter